MTAANSLDTAPADSVERPAGGEPGGNVDVDRAWLHSFAVATRTATRQSLSITNSCVLTTRIGLAVLEKVGVSARPMPVFVTVHNMEAWRLAEQGVPIPNWPNSAHSVGVDDRAVMNPSPSAWNGHLVLLVKRPGKPRLLVDLTADQFDRPIRNLNVGGPVFMDIPADATWTPQDPLFTTIGGREAPDAIVSYRPMPPGHREASRWKQSLDWLSPDKWVNECVNDILDVLPPPGRAVPANGPAA